MLVVLAALALCLRLPAAPDSAGEREASEAAVKAALVVKLSNFVVWPESAFPSTNAPLRIGILGKHPFGQQLDRMIPGKTLGSHPLQVTYGATIDDLAGCALIFVSRDRQVPLDRVVRHVRGRPVLLVGEEPDFARSGGMVNILIRDQKPFLQISTRAAEQQGLRFRGTLAQTRNVEWLDSPSP